MDLLAPRKYGEMIPFKMFYYWDLANCLLLLFLYLDDVPPNYYCVPFSYKAAFLSVGTGPLLSWFNPFIAEQVQGNKPNDAIRTHIIFSQL